MNELRLLVDCNYIVSYINTLLYQIKQTQITFKYALK